MALVFHPIVNGLSHALLPKSWECRIFRAAFAVMQIEKPDKRQIAYPAFSQDGQHIGHDQ